MKLEGRRVLICDCGKTMPLDGMALAAALGTEEPFVHTQLCRQQIDNYKAALNGGEPVLVGCTQEAPLFSEIADESGLDAAVAFTNIRERAGWSADGLRATPKAAALLAEAAIPIEPTPALTLKSEGAVLVYGEGETALAAARQLAGRLAVTFLLKDAGDILPPPVMDVAITSGRIRRASGHLGAFEIGIDDYAVYVPSSRTELRFRPTGESVTARFDLILDLSGDMPLFPAPDRRDGYVRAEPSDPVRLQRALFDLSGMIGEFEKPRFLKIDPALCAHRRNGIVGCTLVSRCVSHCGDGAEGRSNRGRPARLRRSRRLRERLPDRGDRLRCAAWRRAIRPAARAGDNLPASRRRRPGAASARPTIRRGNDLDPGPCRSGTAGPCCPVRRPRGNANRPRFPVDGVHPWRPANPGAGRPRTRPRPRHPAAASGRGRSGVRRLGL